MEIEKLLGVFRILGCTKVYIKELSENDNSKNQVYLGGDFSVLNIFPNLKIEPSQSGSHSKPIFKAQLSFSWIGEDGNGNVAPFSQLILYPQYPEVRFSGFLRGCEKAPSEIMATRQKGRILVLGVHNDGRIFGYAYPHQESPFAFIKNKYSCTSQGVFNCLSLDVPQQGDGKEILLKELYRIYMNGWIKSKRLHSDGSLGECEAPQCGGYTLEAELGVRPNGFKEPDFCGWEVKQYKVGNLSNISVGVITLITPEPNGGIYVDEGVIPFVKKYGYVDKMGRADRMNFGTIHQCNKRNMTTNLQMEITGFDIEKRKIIDARGGISLIDENETIAASWTFAGLMEHWNKKHAHTVFVPSLTRKSPCLQYRYGNRISLGENSDFSSFLYAMSKGVIYYDPGIKVESVSSKPKAKKRSQFRIKTKDISSLYCEFKVIELEKIFS